MTISKPVGSLVARASTVQAGAARRTRCARLSALAWVRFVMAIEPTPAKPRATAMACPTPPAPTSTPAWPRPRPDRRQGVDHPTPSKVSTMNRPSGSIRTALTTPQAWAFGSKTSHSWATAAL